MAKREDQFVLGFGLLMGFVGNEKPLNIPRWTVEVKNICVINKPGHSNVKNILTYLAKICQRHLPQPFWSFLHLLFSCLKCYCIATGNLLVNNINTVLHYMKHNVFSLIFINSVAGSHSILSFLTRRLNYKWSVTDHRLCLDVAATQKTLRSNGDRRDWEKTMPTWVWIIANVIYTERLFRQFTTPLS